MSDGYFAYGSNMHAARMLERIASATFEGAALLRGFDLVCNKRGRDGTAKANLVERPEGFVWGVLWRLPPDGWGLLDRFEADYRREPVLVELSGSRVPAQTYVSTLLQLDRAPLVSYKRHLCEGAREHGLPAEWIAFLEALPER